MNLNSNNKIYVVVGLLLLLPIMACSLLESNTIVLAEYVDVPSSSFEIRPPQDYSVMDLDGMLYLEKTAGNAFDPSFRIRGSRFKGGQHPEEWTQAQIRDTGWNRSKEVTLNDLQGTVFYYDADDLDAIAHRIAVFTTEQEGIAVTTAFTPEKEAEAETLFQAMLDSIRQH